MLTLITEWQPLRHAFESPAYQLLPEQIGIVEDEPDRIAIQAAYRDGTRADLGNISCTWRSSPSLAIPLQWDPNGCSVTITGSPPDRAADRTKPLPVLVSALDSGGRTLAEARLLLYPFGMPAIVAERDLAWGRRMQIDIGAPRLPGLDIHCLWKQRNFIPDADRCRTSMIAPTGGHLEQTVTIDVDILVRQSADMNQPPMKLTPAAFAIELHPPVIPLSQSSANPPQFGPQAPALLPVVKGVVLPSVDMSLPQTAHVAAILDSAALIASLGSTTGPARYLRLAATLRPRPQGQLSVSDMAALLDGIIDERLRLDALETLLLPLAPLPIPASDAIQLLAGIRGENRLELLTLLGPCLSRPILPSVRDDLIGDANGVLWHEIGAALDDRDRVCGFTH